MLLDLQIASEAAGLPDEEAISRWVAGAADGLDPDTEMTVRIVDREESAALNLTYRGKQGPTNVLSFPFEAPAGLDVPLLGDLVICAPVVFAEAEEQGKTPEAHWAHMLVHGVLHLRGYDHIDPVDADIMESRERDILATFGFADPYL